MGSSELKKVDFTKLALHQVHRYSCHCFDMSLHSTSKPQILTYLGSFFANSSAILLIESPCLVDFSGDLQCGSITASPWILKCSNVRNVRSSSLPRLQLRHFESLWFAMFRAQRTRVRESWTKASGPVGFFLPQSSGINWDLGKFYFPNPMIRCLLLWGQSGTPLASWVENDSDFGQNHLNVQRGYHGITNMKQWSLDMYGSNMLTGGMSVNPSHFGVNKRVPGWSTAMKIKKRILQILSTSTRSLAANQHFFVICAIAVRHHRRPRNAGHSG